MKYELILYWNISNRSKKILAKRFKWTNTTENFVTIPKERSIQSCSKHKMTSGSRIKWYDTQLSNTQFVFTGDALLNC